MGEKINMRLIICLFCLHYELFLARRVIEERGGECRLTFFTRCFAIFVNH